MVVNFTIAGFLWVVLISATAFIFPTHYKTFFYKYSDTMLVNMNSILKTVEDAYDEVDHLVTITILKFIGLKDDPKASSKGDRGQTKGYPLRALRLSKWDNLISI